MLGESHELAEDFPEFRDRIEELRQSDPHFAEVFDDYRRVNKAVVRAELRRTTHSDVYTQELKRTRVAQKDELYAMLRS